MATDQEPKIRVITGKFTKLTAEATGPVTEKVTRTQGARLPKRRPWGRDLQEPDQIRTEIIQGHNGDSGTRSQPFKSRLVAEGGTEVIELTQNPAVTSSQKVGVTPKASPEGVSIDKATATASGVFSLDQTVQDLGPAGQRLLKSTSSFTGNVKFRVMGVSGSFASVKQDLCPGAGQEAIIGRTAEDK